ncbi:hypothetical protein, partial [Sinomonas gamaensis]|uniref:hypothetical protein n=1 Tax=Sinomonas gamaensis TaxID=2565624 RepID=UPI001BB0F4B8
MELLIRQGSAIYDGVPWIDREGDIASVDVDKLLYESGVWSGGEQRVVRIAVSLLVGPAVDLSEATTLDRRNLALVLAAIAHAAGSHEDADLRYDGQGNPRAPSGLNPSTPGPPDASRPVRLSSSSQKPT